MLNVYEARTNFSKVLDRVAHGEEITIAKAGRPVAKIVPVEEPPKRVPGVMKGQIWMADDWDEFTEQDDRDWFGDPE